MKLYTLLALIGLTSLALTSNSTLIAQTVLMEAQLYGKAAVDNSIETRSLNPGEPSEATMTIFGDERLIIRDKATTTYELTRIENVTNATYNEVYPWLGNFRSSTGTSLTTISIWPSTHYLKQFEVRISTSNLDQLYITRILS